MPVFQLTKQIAFPSPEDADEDGLLAVGGDLSAERLLLAYRNGIFPWYSDGQPILWWSPDPRMVLFPKEFKPSKSLRRAMKKHGYRVTMDTAFEKVIRACADVVRHDQEGTWITRDMEQAYIEIHLQGFAHSVETWQDDRLVGGLYGIAMGSCFFGESMFARATDASKTGFMRLMEQLNAWDFDLVDCQVRTPHLASLGARDIPRPEFLQRLREGLENPTRQGLWAFDEPSPADEC